MQYPPVIDPPRNSLPEVAEPQLLDTRTEEQIAKEKLEYELDFLDRLPFQENENVWDFCLEGRPPADGFELDPFDVDHLPTVQLHLDTPGWLKPQEIDEENRIRERAQHACARCPGHCCLALVLSFTKADMRRNLAAVRKRRRALLKEIEVQGADDLNRRASWLLRSHRHLWRV